MKDAPLFAEHYAKNLRQEMGIPRYGDERRMKMIQKFVEDPQWYPAALVSAVGDKDPGPVMAELGHMGRLGLVTTKDDQRFMYQWALNDPYHKVRVAKLESKMRDAERRIEHIRGLVSNEYTIRTFALLLRVHQYMTQSFIATALDQSVLETRTQLRHLIRAGLVWPKVAIDGSQGPVWQVRGLTEKEVEDAEHTFAELLEKLPDVIAEHQILFHNATRIHSELGEDDDIDLRLAWKQKINPEQGRRVLKDLNLTDEENPDLVDGMDIDGYLEFAERGVQIREDLAELPFREVFYNRQLNRFRYFDYATGRFVYGIPPELARL